MKFIHENNLNYCYTVIATATIKATLFRGAPLWRCKRPVVHSIPLGPETVMLLGVAPTARRPRVSYLVAETQLRHPPPPKGFLSCCKLWQFRLDLRF